MLEDDNRGPSPRITWHPHSAPTLRTHTPGTSLEDPALLTAWEIL